MDDKITHLFKARLPAIIRVLRTRPTDKTKTSRVGNQGSRKEESSDQVLR